MNSILKSYVTAKEAIEMLYERELEASTPSTNVKLTLQVSPGHSAMLDLLSKRFSIAKYILI